MVSGMDAEAILPQSVLRNIGDKLYEKRKSAALEVEQIVKTKSPHADKLWIKKLIKKLVDDYAHSAQANHRKGGLLCLAAIAVGLGPDACADFLHDIVPPVLESFRDHDNGVRYYGLEALYNIAKVSRESFMQFFSDTFDSLFRLCADAESRVQNAAMILDNMIKDIVAACENFDIDAFIPRLAAFLSVPHVPHKRRFLIDWTSLLQSCPNIDMLVHLPDLLEGMLSMLSDSHTEIKTAAGRTLENFLRQIEELPDSVDFAALNNILVRTAQSADEVTRLTSLQWILSFLSTAGDQLMGCFADLIIAVLPCISHHNKDIREAAMACNKRLLAMDLSSKMRTIGLEAVLAAVSSELRSQQEPTRLEALRWVQALLQCSKSDVLQQWQVLMPALLDAITAPSDNVVMQALQVCTQIAQEEAHFKLVLRALLDRFQGDQGPSLLQARGTLIVRGLCGMLGGIKVFSELATILETQTNLAFAAMMVQALNLMLLTAPELTDLRSRLQNARHDATSAQLLRTLYNCWCHSACAALGLCFLARAYTHTEAMIHALADLPLGPWLLAQLDRLVMLIEAPAFSSLRLQLLAPDQHPDLMRSMYSLLMICPQSTAFHTLRVRLSSIPTLALLSLNGMQARRTHHTSPSKQPPVATPPSDGPCEEGPAGGERSDPTEVELPWTEMLQVFKDCQMRHICYHEEQDQQFPWKATETWEPEALLSPPAPSPFHAAAPIAGVGSSQPGWPADLGLPFPRR